MAKIEVRTRYLFPDALASGKKYSGVFMSNEIKIQKGKEVPYIVLMADIGEGLTEYELCVWNIQSKVITDTDLIPFNQILGLERKGKYIYVTYIGDGNV